MAKKKRLTQFDQGIFYAAALLVTFIDQPGYAADILEQGGFLDADVSSLDETEQLAMKSLMEQEPRRAKFTGFTV